MKAEEHLVNATHRRHPFFSRRPALGRSTIGYAGKLGAVLASPCPAALPSEVGEGVLLLSEEPPAARALVPWRRLLGVLVGDVVREALRPREHP